MQQFDPSTLRPHSRAVPERSAAAAAALPGVRLLDVDGEQAGQRIDNFLLRTLKGVPKSHVYRLLRRGEVRVNKGRVKADYRLRAGDEVRIPPVRRSEPGEARRMPDDWLARVASAILYEDERLLVVDKPAGLAVHGGSGLAGGLIETLRQLRPGAELELVHRLDRDTSGCLAVAKRRSTLRDLHGLIREGGMEKRYLALLLGDLPRPELTVDAPLAKHVLAGGERLVRVDPAHGKPSRTRFARIERLSFGGRPVTFAQARLLTGRTHQIRVHAAHLGAPLAGDPKYGDFDANRRLKALGQEIDPEAGWSRLFLHAAGLAFRADYMDRPLHVEAPLPAELAAVLDGLRSRACAGAGAQTPASGGRP